MKGLSVRTHLIGAVVAIAMGTAGGGCASYAVMPDDAMARLSEAHQGELLYLKQSVYAGQFYDDDRYRLVHPRRFEELTYLQNAEGGSIPPPPADEIIPAGTRVRVEKIEWPDGDAVFRRPLYTPRFTTWIFLRVARSRGDVTIERQDRHIMLLPGGIGDEATFNEWFDATLTRTDPNNWLRSLPDDQRVAIDQKKPRVGMSYDALTAAMGFPDRISRESQDGHTIEVAIWGATSVVLRDGSVERFSSPSASSPMRPASAAPTTPTANTESPSMEAADGATAVDNDADTAAPEAEAPGDGEPTEASDAAFDDADASTTTTTTTTTASPEEPTTTLVDAPGTEPVPVVPPANAPPGGP